MSMKLFSFQSNSYRTGVRYYKFRVYKLGVSFYTEAGHYRIQFVRYPANGQAAYLITKVTLEIN